MVLDVVVALTLLEQSGDQFFLPFAYRDVLRLSYGQIPWTAWAGTAFSFLFAIVLAYSFWYFGVSRIGPTRTAVYANLTPAIALLVSWLALGERLGLLQLVGAGVIFLGIYIVRRNWSSSA